jgi:hypothetical protein
MVDHLWGWNPASVEAIATAAAAIPATVAVLLAVIQQGREAQRRVAAQATKVYFYQYGSANLGESMEKVRYKIENNSDAVIEDLCLLAEHKANAGTAMPNLPYSEIHTRSKGKILYPGKYVSVVRLQHSWETVRLQAGKAADLEVIFDGSLIDYSSVKLGFTDARKRRWTVTPSGQLKHWGGHGRSGTFGRWRYGR